jgi:hypothetical protein
VRWIGPLHENREIQSCRSTANDVDFHSLEICLAHFLESLFEQVAHA